MNATPLIQWRRIAAALACAILTVILTATGCATPETTAGAVAAAAVSSIVSAATQPTTAPAAAVATVNPNPKAAQAIWGRWVRKIPVVNSDGSITSGVVSELEFGRNGSFMSQHHVGPASSLVSKGTFGVFAGVLTIHIGQVQQTYTFRITGEELALTNPKTHQTILYQRG